MKKRTLRMAAAIITLALLTALIAGCGNNGNGNNAEEGTNNPGNPAEMPEYVFVPEYISLSSEIMDVSHLTIIGDKLFFASQSMDEETYNWTTKLFSVNFDGTSLSELVNYTLDLKPEDTPEGAMGHDQILGMFSDAEGNLWVAESGQYYLWEEVFDDYGEDDEDTGIVPIDDVVVVSSVVSSVATVEIPRPAPISPGGYQDLGSFSAVRKLDSTGRELLSLDISDLSDGMEYFYISTISIDNASNIYVGAGNTVFVLDSNGRLQFKLDNDNWIDQFIRMPDGSIAFSGWTETGRALRKIDAAARGWGESIDLPMMYNQMFPGAGDYGFIYSDGNNLFGFDESTGESEKLLNWIDSDVSPDGLGNITMLPDGRILCTIQSWSNTTGRSNVEILILTRVASDSLPPRTVLTMAAMYLEWNVRNAVVQFNKTNTQYRIRVTDYSEFRTEDDWMAGLTRLTTELTTGNIPDILVTSNLPFNQYVARGLFEDLNPFIDSDPRLNRSDLIENVFRATEINGGLYQIFPSFYISTMIGNPLVVGREMGWNMDEFTAFLRANPETASPMGPYMTKESFMQQAVTMNIDEFVDWSAGRTNFDGGGFAKILEFANTFPDEVTFDWENDEWVDENELIATGQQLVAMMSVYDFWSIRMYRALFGGDIVFKGFPTESRNGNVLTPGGTGIAMTTSCVDQEGAWAFMRMILTEDWQRENMRWGFSTNKIIFDEMLKEQMTPQTYIDEDGNEVEITDSIGWGWGSGGGMTIEINAMSQEEADQLMALINSVTAVSSTVDESLMNIIMEGANDFFIGRSSVQDAARVIQSRASIYVAEQS